MSKVVIVYCHPNLKSFTSSVCQAVQKGLTESGCPFEVVDLYAENFDPVLIVNEEHRRRDLDSVSYTKGYREQITNAHTLIFVYPVWWGGFPALLKGFIDRVFVSGVTYSFSGKHRKAVFPNGLMKGKDAHFFYTLDSPLIVAMLDPGWFSNYFTVFKYCGFQQVRRYYLSRLKLTDEQQRTEWLAKVSANAKKIGQTMKK